MAKQTFKQMASDAASSVLSVAQMGRPFPNVRMGYGITNRDKQIMTWRLPSGDNVQMYINPQQFVIAQKKSINYTRTKGGYVVQYWGEQLPQLTLSGTTGSSGVKGINVLNDIYRAEHNAFELVAASQLNEIQQVLAKAPTSKDMDILKPLADAARTMRENGFLLRPSLASLATSIILYYQGIQYKGFFMDFTVTESAEKTGLFDYSLTFMATEIRGKRQNYLPWHKEPLADDMAGQLLNGVGNALRRAVGLAEQAPTQFHPENAPYSFGGNSLAPSLGMMDFTPPENMYDML